MEAGRFFTKTIPKGAILPFGCKEKSVNIEKNYGLAATRSGFPNNVIRQERLKVHQKAARKIGICLSVIRSI